MPVKNHLVTSPTCCSMGVSSVDWATIFQWKPLHACFTSWLRKAESPHLPFAAVLTQRRTFDPGFAACGGHLLFTPSVFFSRVLCTSACVNVSQKTWRPASLGVERGVNLWISECAQVITFHDLPRYWFTFHISLNMQLQFVPAVRLGRRRWVAALTCVHDMYVIHALERTGLGCLCKAAQFPNDNDRCRHRWPPDLQPYVLCVQTYFGIYGQILFSTSPFF